MTLWEAAVLQAASLVSWGSGRTDARRILENSGFQVHHHTYLCSGYYIPCNYIEAQRTIDFALIHGTEEKILWLEKEIEASLKRADYNLLTMKNGLDYPLKFR